MGIFTRLEKIQIEWKIHLVNWKTIYSGNEKGGLGIRNLVLFNRTLLGNWAWRFVVEENSVYRSIIWLKYETEKGDGSLILLGEIIV